VQLGAPRLELEGLEVAQVRAAKSRCASAASPSPSRAATTLPLALGAGRRQRRVAARS
jgi:hypothetical protein